MRLPLEFAPEKVSVDFAFQYLRDRILPKYLTITDRVEHCLWLYLNQSYGQWQGEPKDAAIRCFVNAQSRAFCGDPNNISGDIQFAPIEIRKGKNGWNIREDVPPGYDTVDMANCRLLFDSGAFPEVRVDRRVTPKHSLDRQLVQLAQFPVQPSETWIVSYDRLIDEKHIDGDRVKQRWTEDEAELALTQTIDAAKYLDSQRYRIKKHTLVQSCQGVTPSQYLRCVESVLEFCQPQDVLGLGGWCILGKQKKWLPTFWDTIELVIPRIAEAGIKRAHIFGVTWWKQQRGFTHTPLSSLLWLCDQYGIELTTDSRSPIGKALWKGDNAYRAGALYPYWRWNLALVRTILASLRSRPEYQSLPRRNVQLSLF